MNFLHKTLISSNELLFCTVKKLLSKSLVEVIMAFKNRVDFAKLEYLSDSKKILYSPSFSYYIETPIIWGEVNGDYFYTLTEKFDFIISKMYDIPKKDEESFMKFEQIFSMKLEKISNSSKTRAISWNQKYICFAADENELILIDVNNKIMPNFKIINLKKLEKIGINVENVIRIVPSKNEASFLILVKVFGNKKLILSLDGKTKKINDKDTIETDENIIDLIYSIDQKDHQVFMVSADTIYDINNNVIIKTPSPIILISNIVNQTISAFLEDESYFCYSFSQQMEQIFAKANKFSKIFSLPNNILILYSNALFIGLNIPSSKKLQSSAWEDLEKGEIIEKSINHSKIKEMIFVKNKLYLLNEHGIFNLTNQENGALDEEIQKFKTPVRLFTLTSDLQFYSTSAKTNQIKLSHHHNQQIKISQDHPTKYMYLIDNKIVQVLQKGIMKEGKNILSGKNILFSDYDSNNNNLVVIAQDNEIIFYKNNFNKPVSFQFDLDADFYGGEITSVSICKSYIAIATFNTGNGDEQDFCCRGCIFLLDFELNILGESLDIPSPIEYLLTLQDGNELYAFLENGAILKIMVNENGITQSLSYIFFGSQPTSVVKLDENSFSFLSDSSLLIYMKNHIVSTGLNGIVSISFDGELLWFIQDDEKSENKNIKYHMHSIDIFELDDTYVSIPAYTKSSPLHFISFPKINFLLKTNSIYATYGIRLKTKSFRFNLNDKIPLTFSGFTKYSKKHKLFSYYLIITYDDKRSFTILKYNKNKQFTVYFDFLFQNNLNSILYYCDLLLIALDNSLYACKLSKSSDKTHRKELRFMRGNIQFSSPIKYLSEYNNYIWVITKGGEICVYIYDKKIDRFLIVAHNSLNIDISAIHHVDELTLLISYENGQIAFYQIPLNASIGSYLNFSFNSIPKLCNIFSYSLSDTVSSFLTMKNCILYSTISGAIGAFIPINSQEYMNHIIDIQHKIRKINQEIIGFSHSSRNATCSNRNIIDFDLINFYQDYLEKEKKNEQENLLDTYDISFITKTIQLLAF